MKVCTKCGTEKPHSEFGRKSDQRDGLNTWCKMCVNEYTIVYNKKNPERRRESTRRWREKNRDKYKSSYRGTHLKKYGLTLQEYTTLLEQQGGVCAICACAPCRRRFAVDHDHTDGNIRGLLCSNCNTGIGLLGDSPGRLQAAIAYLSPKRHLRSA